MYKSSKQKWDDAGTYNTPRDAAIQAAIAQRELDKGFGWQYSPLKKRPQKGPLCVLAHALSCLPHKLKHAPTSQPSIQCSHVKVKSPPRILMPSTALVNGWMRSCPAFCCPLHTPTLPPHACSGIRLTVCHLLCCQVPPPLRLMPLPRRTRTLAICSTHLSSCPRSGSVPLCAASRWCRMVACTRAVSVAARSWLVASVCVGGFQQHNRQTPTSLHFLRVLCGLGCLCEQNQLPRARFIRPQQRVSLC